VVGDLVSSITTLEVRLEEGRPKLDRPVEVGERGGIAGLIGIQAPTIHIRPREIRRELQRGVVVGKRLLVMPPLMQQPPPPVKQRRFLGRRTRPGRQRRGHLRDRRRVDAALIDAGGSERTRQPQRDAGNAGDDRQVPVAPRTAESGS
jgi:hypothetical protein